MQADPVYTPTLSPEHIYLATMLSSMHLAALHPEPAIRAEYPGRYTSTAVVDDNKSEVEQPEMGTGSMGAEFMTIEREYLVSGYTHPPSETLCSPEHYRLTRVSLMRAKGQRRHHCARPSRDLRIWRKQMQSRSTVLSCHASQMIGSMR